MAAQVSERQQPGQAAATTPQEAFIEILNNMDKQRRGGFVVLARHSTSLHAVQGWCLEQSWNHEVLAARYRIGSGPVLGTALAALMTDLDYLVSQDPRDVKLLGRGDKPNLLIRTRGGHDGRAVLTKLKDARQRQRLKEMLGWLHGPQGTLDGPQVEFVLELLAQTVASEVG
jgi:hypothetical protein